MTRRQLSRRGLIKGSAALGFAAFAAPLKAEAPEPVAITPQLIDAARREGKVVLYSAMDLPVGEKLGNTFQAQYPGIEVQIERSGSDRPGVLFQHPRRRRRHHGGCLSRHLVEAERLAGALRPGRRREIFSERISRRRRPVCDIAHLAVVDRLQHQPRQSP